MKTATYGRNSAIVITLCSIWMVFFLTDLPVWGYIENPVVLTDEQHHYPLGFHLAFLEDPTRTLTIDDVTAPQYADRFMPGSEDVSNFGIGSVVYWIRIPMKNETQHINDWRLRIESSYLDFIETYVPNIDTQDPPFTVKRSGDSIPFSEWDTAHRQFVFKIFLQPHTEQTVYLRIENADGIIARMSVWSVEAFAEQIVREQLWYGFYFGSLCIMACYNFFIFLSLRDKSYLYYVLFVLSWGLNEFCAKGFAYQYLWPNLPQWNEPISVLFGTLSAFFALRFTANFLKLATLHPVINRVVMLLSAGWFVTCGATYITDLGTTNVFIQLLTLGSLAIIVFAPMTSWRHGYRPARYLLLAWIAFAMTGTTSVLTSLGILPTVAILLYSYPIGVILLMLLLSWALADRINEMKTQAEQKRLQTLELQQAKNLAEVANQAKSMFLANMSHELRTPLNAILGFAQVIARNPNIPPEEHDNLGIIQRSGEHLLTLINQVLNLSKIEAGRIILNEDNVDVHRMLHDLHDMFAFHTNKKHLQLLFERDESVPRYVRTDEVKLREVLMNLLSNAIKYTEAGEIQLSVSSEQLSVNEKQLSGQSEDMITVHRLLFTVKDTGPGIASEEMDLVFEAFGQTATGRQVQEGTGLGLPISRGFIQLMGGDIHVESKIGQGTVFTFDIQAQEVDTADTPLTPSTRRVIALETGQSRYRMLIVDDNQDNRQLLFKLLNPFDFDLREAENGQEAIDIWDTWEPHLIWMDIRMPVLDGYEATQQIRKAEGKRQKAEEQNTKHQTRTIIVAVTASSYEEEQAVVLSAGCDDFLRKPFSDVEVFEMLHKHLGIRFVYEEETQSSLITQQSTIEEVLTPEALAALPAKWLETLRQGARRADFILLSSVIEQIREQDARLASALAQLAEDFEYDEILAFIQQIGKQTME